MADGCWWSDWLAELVTEVEKCNRWADEGRKDASGS